MCRGFGVEEAGFVSEVALALGLGDLTRTPVFGRANAANTLGQWVQIPQLIYAPYASFDAAFMPKRVQ